MVHIKFSNWYDEENKTQIKNPRLKILCFSDAKNMARDVNDIIVEIISEFKQVPTQGAIDFVKSE